MLRPASQKTIFPLICNIRLRFAWFPVEDDEKPIAPKVLGLLRSDARRGEDRMVGEVKGFRTEFESQLFFDRERANDR